jgi:hypothetical protein
MKSNDELHRIATEYACRVNASHCGYLGLMLIHDERCHGPLVLLPEYPEQMYSTGRSAKRYRPDMIQYDDKGGMILVRVKQEAQRGWIHDCNQTACECASCKS